MVAGGRRITTVTSTATANSNSTTTVENNCDEKLRSRRWRRLPNAAWGRRGRQPWLRWGLAWDFLLLQHPFQYCGGFLPSLGPHVLDMPRHCGLVPSRMCLFKTV